MNIFQELSKTKRSLFGRKRPLTESPHLVENYEEFDPWFRTFIRMGTKYDSYQPSKLSTWFDSVQDAHLEIRKRLDGFQINSHFDLKDIQRSAEMSSAGPIISHICTILPAYKSTYYLKTQDLLSPTMRDYKGIKTSKHISEYAKVANLSDDQKKELDRLLSALGNEWAKARVKEQKVFTTLSTEAKAFALLGHYGADWNSCFKQGGAKNSNKFHLGECENTFVFLVHDTNCKGVDSSSKNWARAWGFFDPKQNVVNFTNLYLTKHLSQGNALEIMKLQAAQLLNANPSDVKSADDLIDRSPGLDIHLNNNNDTISFYVGDTKPPKQTIRLSI